MFFFIVSNLRLEAHCQNALSNRWAGDRCFRCKVLRNGLESRIEVVQARAVSGKVPAPSSNTTVSTVPTTRNRVSDSGLGNVMIKIN